MTGRRDDCGQDNCLCDEHYTMPPVPTRHMVAIPAEEYARLVRAEAEAERYREQAEAGEPGAYAARCRVELEGRLADAIRQRDMLSQAAMDQTQRTLSTEAQLRAELSRLRLTLQRADEEFFRMRRVLFDKSERYRAALEEIANGHHRHGVDGWLPPGDCPACIARRALEGEGE